MSKTSSIALPLCALAAALVAAPLAAREPVVVTGEPRPVYQERVNFDDLDLRQSKARYALSLRVRRASERVCGEADGSVSGPGAAWGQDAGVTCAEKTYDYARPQIRTAVDRARSGQQLAATAVFVSAPRGGR